MNVEKMTQKSRAGQYQRVKIMKLSCLRMKEITTEALKGIKKIKIILLIFKLNLGVSQVFCLQITIFCFNVNRFWS